MITNVYIGVVAQAAGTVDAITATYLPAPAVLADKMLLWFRATGANTTPTPTFKVGALDAKTIVKQGGQALAAGDIPGVGAVMEVCYDETAGKWELINPASATLGYKVYKALLNQSGINNPVATVLKNTLGGSGTWTYSGDGVFNIATAGLFTANKTGVVLSTWSDGATSIYVSQFQIIDTSNIEIYTSLFNTATKLFDRANDALANTLITIEVHP